MFVNKQDQTAVYRQTDAPLHNCNIVAMVLVINNGEARGGFVVQMLQRFLKKSNKFRFEIASRRRRLLFLWISIILYSE